MEEKTIDFDVADLIERIDAKIAELEKQVQQLNLEEEKMLQKVKQILKEYDLKYIYNLDRPKMLEIPFGMNNKPFRMQILLQNEKMILRVLFPFRVQCNSLALLAIYMSQFNDGKAFSLMNVDLDDGEITMNYSFLIEKADEFNSHYFHIYMTILIDLSLKVYTRIQRLAVGKLSSEDKEYFKILLQKSLAVINEDEEDEEDIIFGSEVIKNNRYKEQKNWDFERNVEQDNTFNSVVDSEDTSSTLIVPEFLRRDLKKDMLQFETGKTFLIEEEDKNKTFFMPFEEVDVLSESKINEE